MRRIWYVIAALAALVVIAIFVRGRSEPLAVATPTPTPTPEIVASTPTPTPTPRPIAKARPTPTPTPVPVPSYDDVASQYTGRRIQFDAYCAMVPADNTFIVGTDVLLDNRAPDDRVVNVGGVEYGLAAFGWKVITMTATELPAIWAVDCGTAKNVGKITINPLTTPEPLPTPASSSDPLVSPSPDASPTASASPELSPTP